MALIEKTKAKFNAGVTFTPVAGASSQTIAVGKDERTLVYVNNGGASAVTVTISKGTAVAAAKDLTISVAAGAASVFMLESAKYADDGIITMGLSATASVTVGVIQL